MDSLSPESRALYEILMADTPEMYESKFAAYKKERLDAVRQFVDDTRMRIKDLQPTVGSAPGKVEIEVDSIKVALGEDLVATKPALSSDISALAPDLAGVKPDTTVDDLSPGARRYYDYLAGASTNLDPVREAVGMGAADLVDSAPTTCLAECQSHDNDVPATVLIPSTTPNSSTTTGGVISELAAPMDSIKALDMDSMVDTAPLASICSPGGPDHSTGREDPKATSLTTWSAPPSFNASPTDLLCPPSASMAPASWPWLLGDIEVHRKLITTNRAGSRYNSAQSALSTFQLPIEHSLDTEGPWECVSYLQPKPPWSRLAPTISTSELVSDMWTVSEILHIIGTSFQLDLLGFAAWYMFCARLRLEAYFPLPCVNQQMLKSSERKRQIQEYNGLTWQNCSYKGILSANAAHYVSASSIWCIARSLVEPSCAHPNFGGSTSLIMQLTVKNMELRSIKIFWYLVLPVKPRISYDKCSLPLWQMQSVILAASPTLVVIKFSCRLLIKWPGVLVSTRTSFCPTLSNAKKFVRADICSPNYQSSTILQNPSCRNGWHSLLLPIPWLQVPYLAVPRCIIYTFSAFLANLDGRAEVHHILQGHPHYYELMQGSLYHSILQSELTPWTSEFATESSIHFLDELHSSIALVKLHDLLMEMVKLRPWPFWELFSCIATVSRYLLGAFHILASLVFISKGMCSRSTPYLEVDSLDAFFAKLRTWTASHAGKLYWLLGLHSSCYPFVTEVGDHWKFNFALVFSWDVSSTIGSAPANQYIHSAILLLSNGLSKFRVLYLHIAGIIQWGSKMMQWGFARSNDGILTYTNHVLISWDPGGSDPILAAA